MSSSKNCVPCPGTTKRSVGHSISFIKNANPDIFSLRPRPGGILPIDENAGDFSGRIGDDPHSRDVRELQLTLDEKISKEFRVQTALELEDDEFSVVSEEPCAPNPLKDTMYMFGVTISTLIMMASKRPDIPQEYLQWTMHCMNCIRDDFGNHPPNVQGILNHIGLLTGQTGGGGGGVEEQGVSTNAGGPEMPGEEVAADQGEVTGGETGEEDEGGEQTVRTTTTVKMGEEDE